MPGSASKAPRRTTSTSGSSPGRLQSALPQTEQKSFVAPSGGSNAWISSSPLSTRSDPGTITAFTDAAVPVRRWQRVQWQ